MRNNLTGPVIGVVVIIAILMSLYAVALSSTKDVVDITVVEKERVVQRSGDDITSKYLVFGEDEVFENTDCIIFGKFTSSDLQRDLKIGETYEVLVVGWRMPFISSYRNIIRIENER